MKGQPRLSPRLSEILEKVAAATSNSDLAKRAKALASKANPRRRAEASAK